MFRYEVPEDWIRPYGVRTDPILIREVRFRMIDSRKIFQSWWQAVSNQRICLRGTTLSKMPIYYNSDL